LLYTVGLNHTAATCTAVIEMLFFQNKRRRLEAHSVPLWQDTCRRVQEAVSSTLVWSKDRAKWWQFDTNLRFPARRSRCNPQTVRRHTAEWTWWEVWSHGLQGFFGGDDASEVAAATEVLRSVSSERM